MNVYVLIIEDRHCDVDAHVYASKEEAIERARTIANQYCKWGEVDETLTGSMRQSGWVYHGIYSCENDSVTVLEREVL